METRDPVGISSLNPVADKDFLSIVNEKTKNLSIQPTSIIPSFQNSMPFNDALQSQSNAFKFVPPKWFYQDPSLLEQGPFTSEQMHNWFKEGYFPPSLPIKCAGDDSFIDLRRFVEKYGSEAPFLVALRDQETLEHEFFMKEASRKNMSSFSHFSQAPSTKLPYSDHRDHTIGYSRPQDQGFLFPTDGYANAHYQQQQLPFMYNRNLGPFIGAESTQFAPAASSTMVGAIQEPISAIGKVEKTFADIPSEIAIQNNVQPDPSSITLPSFQSQNSQNKDKIESGIKQDKFDVAEKKFELNSPEKKPEKEIPVDVKIVKDTQPSPTAKSVAPVAPWAQSKASAAKLTLKDIQEKEQKESEEKRLRKQIESEQKLLAEAHSIAQKKASEVSIVAHSQWGNPSVSTGRKSLVEIMKDEELVKKSGDAPRTSTSSFAKAAAALPTMGATRQPQRIVSQKQDETWQVVGKIEKVSKPITTTAPVPRPNYPISESMNPQPPVQHISSVLQWCRTSLKNAQTKPVTFNGYSILTSR